MSGSKNPLRTKTKWILDTHIYHLAAKNDRDRIQGEGNQLFALILEKCPEVYSSKEQIKELSPHLQRVGYRFPQQMFESLLDLDEVEKFHLRKKSVAPMNHEEKEMFRGRKHDNITDDMHLYELARSTGAEVLVTNDPYQLEHPNRQTIEKTFGVALYRAEDLLRIAEQEASVLQEENSRQEDWKDWEDP